MNWLRRDERLVFVDLGANLGAFTLAAAHMKRQVIAVEPNVNTNRRLARSISMGNVSDYVTLLLNAVSNEHVTTRLGQDVDNRANTFLLGSGNCSQVSIKLFL